MSKGRQAAGYPEGAGAAATSPAAAAPGAASAPGGLPAPVNPGYVHDWTVDDVCQWLGSNDLGHWAEFFRVNKITGDLLLDITRDDLVEMGVVALGDRIRISKAIEKLRVDTQQVSGSVAGPGHLDFLFLGASPLVTRRPTVGVQPLELIDLEAEQHAINKALIDANRTCRFQFDFATLPRLTWAALRRSCTVLIFSGHTLPDGTWLLETPTGEALVFDPFEHFHDEPTEDADLQVQKTLSTDSGCMPLGGRAVQDHAEAVRSSMTLRLVVLCSCHSSFPATLFIEAGVPHVIAVERAETVLDVSARVFVQSLCHSLLVGNTVQSAFQHAQWLVKHNECFHAAGTLATAKKEAQKFVLLPVDASHSTVLFPSQTHGPALDLTASRPPVQFPRTRLDLAILRHVEVWQVLKAIRHHRFVQVVGPPGIGKRTLVCLAAHYMWQRHMFPDGIHYMHVDDLQWLVALDWSFRRLVFQGADGEGNITEGDPECALAATQSRLSQNSFLSQRVALPGYRLLILDGCHGLIQKCAASFLRWLSRVLSDNPNIQVLITSRSSILPPEGDLNVQADGERAEPARAKTEPQEAPESIVEVGELSEQDAVRLLRWRCHVLPEAAAVLEEHGSRLVALCGRQPLALSVCARWLISQLPRTDPRELLEAIEDDARRLEILQPCNVIFDTAIAALPTVFQSCLRPLSLLHAAFAADVAATVWGVGLDEAEHRLEVLREHHLLEVPGAAAQSVGIASSDPDVTTTTLYRMQPLLRQNLRAKAPSDDEGQAVGCHSRLMARYTARILSALMRREEFPNVQLVLDLAGATCSFLVLLWAVRSVGWIHTWLGDKRRVKLYERALAVLAVLPAHARAPPRPAQAEAQDGAAATPDASEASVPSDLFLCPLPAGGAGAAPAPEAWISVDAVRVEALFRTSVATRKPQQSTKEKPWSELDDWVFCQGANITIEEVWGSAARDPSQGLLQPNGEVDELTLPLIAKSCTGGSSLVADVLDPQAHHGRVCEALVELASATRAEDPARAMRLAHSAVARLALAQTPEEPEEGGGPRQLASLHDVGAGLRPLLSDALMEFAQSCLAARGSYTQELVSNLMDHSVAIGHRADPLRFETLRSLRAAALYAIGFEKNPSKSERLHKMCLELKIQKFNTWQHAEIAETLCDCGVLCHVLGDLAHAESMLRAGMGVWRQLDSSRPKLAAAQVDLANLLAEKERWEDAEDLYKAALELQHEVLDWSLQKFQTMNLLALALLTRGSTELASSYLRDCLAGLERALGPGKHLAVAAVHHNLARCIMHSHQCSVAFCQSDKAEEAARHFDEARRVYEALLPPSNASALALQRNRAQFYMAVGKPEKALPLLQGVLQVMEGLGTHSVEELGRVRFQLGSATLVLKQTEKSREHFQWVLRRPTAAAALREVERLAAEEFVGEGSGDDAIAKEKASADEENPADGTPARRSPQRRQTPPGSREAVAEPQGEPEARSEHAAPIDRVNGLLVDVDLSKLSVLNRVQYLMGGRIKAVLGVLPPLVDGNLGGTVPASSDDRSSPASAGEFSVLLANMGLECHKVQQAVAAPGGAYRTEG